MDNLGYLVAAYTVIWIAISAYVFNLTRKQKQLWHEINSLKKQTEETGNVEDKSADS